MPTMSNIVVTDSAATAHTFKPQRITQQDVAIFIEQGSTLNARNELSVQLREVKERNVNRVQVKVSLPVPVSYTDPVTGIPGTRIARTLVASADFSLPRDSSTAEREMLKSLMAAAIENASVEAVIVNGEAFIGA